LTACILDDTPWHASVQAGAETVDSSKDPQ
jgi:hypothetical protein